MNDNNCPDCGREKAHSADDMAAGLCPKWYAKHDAEALTDCEDHQPSSMPVPLSTEKQGTCSECGRGTWDPDEIGNQCFMVQPNSLLCLGVFVKVKQ